MEATTMEISIWLCAECGGYEPLNGGGDFLRGTCERCHKLMAEVHKFTLAVDISRLGPCECSGSHPRRETT